MTKQFLQPDNDKINLKRKQNKVVNQLLASKEILRSTIEELRRNAHPEKPFFSGHFQIWQLEFFFFRKSGFETFWVLPFCIFVPKF